MMARSEAVNEPLLLDAGGLAKLLGVSRRHIQSLDAAGRIPVSISLERCRRWRADEIRAWVAAGCPTRVQWLACTASPHLRMLGGGR